MLDDCVYDLPSWKFHMNAIIQYVTFRVCLLLLSMMFSGSSHRQCSFLFMAEKPSILRIYHILFIHSPTGRLGGFSLLATVNSAAMNTRAQVFV